MIEAIAGRLVKAPDFRGKARLLRTLLTALPVARSYYGPRMRVRRDDYTNWASIWGLYGNQLRDLIRVMPRNGVFLDIGANAGVFSLVASAHLSEGTVVSFEPNKEVFADLVANLRLNGCDNVFPVNAAVGAETVRAHLEFDSHHTGAGFVSRGGPSRRSRSIFVVSPGDFEPVLGLSAGRTAFCKIDVEGAEMEVLGALAGSGLLGRIDAFFVEISVKNLARFGAVPEDVFGLMEANGFATLYRPPGRGEGDAAFCRAGSAQREAVTAVTAGWSQPAR